MPIRSETYGNDAFGWKADRHGGSSNLSQSRHSSIPEERWPKIDQEDLSVTSFLIFRACVNLTQDRYRLAALPLTQGTAAKSGPLSLK